MRGPAAALALFLSLLSAPVAPLRSQTQADHPGTPKPAWFVSAQPLMLFGLPVGGFRTGMERSIGRRVAVAAEFSYRPFNYNSGLAEPGEADRTTGVQLQPEIRWYLEPSGRRELPWMGSFSARLGLSHYETTVRNWTLLTDGSGNSYRKILGFVREQRNYDVSLLWNQRVPFASDGDGFGIEFFMGLGLRLKRFEYLDLSPELDEASLREQDAARMFSLRRDGLYPLLPLGMRLYYRVR